MWHRLYTLKARVTTRFKKNTKQKHSEGTQKSTENLRYNIELPKYDSIKFLYKLRLANKLKNIGTDDNIEETYYRIKKEIHEAAFEALGKKDKILYKPYFWNDEVEKLIDEKKAAYHKWLATNDHEDRKYYARMTRIGTLVELNLEKPGKQYPILKVTIKSGQTLT